jgi:hypothetical protein
MSEAAAAAEPEAATKSTLEPGAQPASESEPGPAPQAAAATAEEGVPPSSAPVDEMSKFNSEEEKKKRRNRRVSAHQMAVHALPATDARKCRQNVYAFLDAMGEGSLTGVVIQKLFLMGYAPTVMYRCDVIAFYPGCLSAQAKARNLDASSAKNARRRQVDVDSRS